MNPYRLLKSLIEQSPRIFGQDSLFGAKNQDHSAIRLFIRYVQSQKRGNDEIPTNIRMAGFKNYIADPNESSAGIDDEKKKEILKKIAALPKGMVKETTLEENTLRNFAIVLNHPEFGMIQNINKLNTYDEHFGKSLQMDLAPESKNNGNNIAGKVSNNGGKIIPTEGSKITEEDKNDASVSLQVENQSNIDIAFGGEGYRPIPDESGVYGKSVKSDSDKEKQEGEESDMTDPDKKDQHQKEEPDKDESPLLSPLVPQPEDEGRTKPESDNSDHEDDNSDDENEENGKNEGADVSNFDGIADVNIPTSDAKFSVLKPKVEELQNSMMILPSRAERRVVEMPNRGRMIKKNKNKRVSESESEGQEQLQVPNNQANQQKQTSRPESNEDPAKSAKRLAKLAGIAGGAGVVWPLMGDTSEAAGFSLVYKIFEIIFS